MKETRGPSTFLCNHFSTPYPKIKMSNKSGYTIISQLGYYNTKEWKQIRLIKLSEKPLCEMCQQEQVLTPATVCDHIAPITLNNIERFFEYNNLQSLCAGCHRKKTLIDSGKTLRVKDGAALKALCESE